MNHRNNIIKLIQEVGYRHGTWQVYSDFLELSAIAISNGVDKRQFKKREERYLEVIARYSEDEVVKIVEAFNELISALEVEIEDVLGRVYQELGLGNKWMGQFFTPFQLSLAAGEIISNGLKDTIKSKGYVTINEPTVGGGSMVLVLCKAMLKEEINYQKHILVIAQDIDIRSVCMSYIQLSLAGVPAVVIHGNSLLGEERSRWYTPMYVMGGWEYIMKKTEEPTKEPIKNKKAG